MAKKRGQKGKSASKHAPASLAPKAVPKKLNDEFDLEAINSVTAASVAMVGQPVMVKLCRLCESKDGPFLNIFDGDKVLAKKINQLLPLVIDEYDKLPHKICFRCSAKVEELHEFAQRCIRTQESLKKGIGESKAAIARKNWEEKLKENKMSNDDYCESLIKQAMEKIIGPSVHDEPLPRRDPTPPPPTPPPMQKKPTKLPNKTPDEVESPPKSEAEVKQAKIIIDRVKNTEKDRGEKAQARATRSRPTEQKEYVTENIKIDAPGKDDLSDDGKDCCLVGMVIKEKDRTVVTAKIARKAETETKEVREASETNAYEKQEKVNQKRDAAKVNGTAEKRPAEKEHTAGKVAIEVVKEKAAKEDDAYDIMQHVCAIKVGGAGYLFQCKLCKRNFLKKEVVMGHHCAKAGAIRKELAGSSKPNPPKPIGKPEMPKPAPIPPKPTPTDREIIEAFKAKTAHSLSINNFSMETIVSKPKPGPASRKKLQSAISDAGPSLGNIGSTAIQKIIPSAPSPPTLPSVQLPSNFPGAKNRYKLVPGPNNTFSLVEDTPSTSEAGPSLKRKSDDTPKVQPQTIHNPYQGRTAKKNTKVVEKNRHVAEVNNGDGSNRPTTSNFSSFQSQSFGQNDQSYGQHASYQAQPNPILAQRMDSQPYPVGLFQTIPRGNAPEQQSPFPTPAMKKHSYTVVQTGHPSKLLISTKQPAPPPPQPPPPPAPKSKKGKKIKAATVEVPAPEPPKQPFSVTIEDSAPSKNPNEGFFTFINVDPLLQPSYVLPTPNIIQESQITTSTPTGVAPAAAKPAPSSSRRGDSEVYTCEFCQLEFSREKKLLTHLQSHYTNIDNEQDDEDDNWNRSAPKKRSRRS